MPLPYHLVRIKLHAMTSTSHQILESYPLLSQPFQINFVFRDNDHLLRYSRRRQLLLPSESQPPAKRRPHVRHLWVHRATRGQTIPPLWWLRTSLYLVFTESTEANSTSLTSSQMTTSYCVSVPLHPHREPDNLYFLSHSPQSARKITGHPTKRSANTPWPRWPPPSSSRWAPITRTKTSPSSSAASPPSTPPSSAGRASKLSNSNVCLPTCASRRSSSSSPRVHRATPIGSTCLFFLTLSPTDLDLLNE